MFTNAELRKRCAARLEAWRDRRWSFHTRWMDLSSNIDPKRGSFLTKAASARNKGTAKDQKIKDSTARDALRTMQSGLMSGATSPARPWFRLSLDDVEASENTDNKLWLAEVLKRMLRVIAESNAYPILHNLYGDLGLFGTAGFLVLEDFEDVIRCYPLTVGEFFVGLDHRLAVNAFGREFSMNVGQLVDKFGLDNCRDVIKSAFKEGRLDQEYDVVHMVEPNDKRNLAVADAEGMAFREVYYETGDFDKFLFVGGYHEFPSMIPRWDVNGSDPYGTSPGMDALPDVKQLAFEQVQKGQGIGKQVNPPMTAPTSMKGEPTTAVPGGVTFLNESASGQGFKPAYQPTIVLRDLTADIEGVKVGVRRAFYADLFMAISQMDGVQPRNNLEIIERKDEKLVQLGPVLERLHGELLKPFILRVFKIMERAGLIPDRPQSMGDVEPKIEFVSVLAQAQKSVGTAGIERYLQFIGGLVEVFPQARYKVEINEAIDAYTDLLGVAPNLVIPTDKAEETADAEAKQAAQQKAIEGALPAAQAGKTLAETDVGGGMSALQMMTGQG